MHKYMMNMISMIMINTAQHDAPSPPIKSFPTKSP